MVTWYWHVSGNYIVVLSSLIKPVCACGYARQCVSANMKRSTMFLDILCTLIPTSLISMCTYTCTCVLTWVKQVFLDNLSKNFDGEVSNTKCVHSNSYFKKLRAPTKFQSQSCCDVILFSLCLSQITFYSHVGRMFK